MLENPQFYGGRPHKTEAGKLTLSSLVSSTTSFNERSGYLKTTMHSSHHLHAVPLLAENGN